MHLLPHWNWEGREGDPIPVFAYTNSEELELFLNGRSLGKKQIERYGHGEWLVPYEPGELTVTAGKDGTVLCSDTRVTTGEAVSLHLKLDNAVPCANGQDVAIVTCYCTDKEGREVPDASPFVSFHTNGLGRIIGTGSDISDHNPVTLPDRKMYAGRITVAVGTGLTAGDLKVYASAPGLTSAMLTIPLTSTN